ncbi:uncharacterized protein F4822DRAFT_93907 [Hypoxylon trugodes]|uniref:uncharacterized protein n=1 Tax=Hypoxylon trugodes TaxID=326681 RepID=UPI00219EB405|nr:uncharacterized protein F4822DRAFT_93907 [Hypoxylon trugodes]KAI1383143.1 hypothetical protein F4822DRAFT_93907 [Hypoxylon trugodes]
MKGMYTPFVLLLFAVTGCLGNQKIGSASGHGLARRGLDNPGPDNFAWHRYPTVVALGDYVYIDGGEISQKSNGTDITTNGTQSYASYSVTSTLSLSLKDSWTNRTVQLQSIPKQAPSLDQQIYWSDPSNGAGAFYTWGGMAAGSATPPTNEQWLFNADGSGGGMWSQVSQSDYRQFAALKQPVGSAFTQGNQIGYALGGQATSKTDNTIQKADPGYALPGLVSYNFQTGDWNNVTTTTDFGGYGTSLNGRAEFVPFGPNGLLVFLGGSESQVDATDSSIVPTNWNSITLHDPVTGKWYKQKTSGMRPVLLERFCSVGVQGPNNTYEIYIYGGNSDQIEGTSPDVHVLSLPGFIFFDAGSLGTPRADHACAVVGKGKRQMLSYGGVNGGPGLRNPTTTADPWKQGLGIYDMSEMKWTDSYDPDAADYESPAKVKDWYDQGNLNNVKWDSPELKGLIINGSIYGTSGDSPPANNSSGGSGTSARKIGAIVGGTVGGVVVVAIAITTMFLLRRRRQRRESQSTIVETLNEYRPEPWPKDSPRMRSTTPGTLISSPTPVEPVEICGISRGELPAGEVELAYELPASPARTPRIRPELPDRTYTS